MDVAVLASGLVESFAGPITNLGRTQDPDLPRQEAQHSRDAYLRSRPSAQLHRDEIQAVTIHLKKARESSKHFRELTAINLTESVVLLLTETEH